MGIRYWLKKRMSDAVNENGDLPLHVSILHSIFGGDEPTPRALGEHDQKTYPRELQELLRRRDDVAQEVMDMDLTNRAARVAAIPRLRELLRTYPHPLLYEALINAYVDEGRWDEARGAAFAARERRVEVSRSPYSEIRGETDRLNEWTPEEVDALRQEREARAAPPA
jgi:pentatricopeptide repeat protein